MKREAKPSPTPWRFAGFRIYAPGIGYSIVHDALGQIVGYVFDNSELPPKERAAVRRANLALILKAAQAKAEATEEASMEMHSRLHDLHPEDYEPGEGEAS